MASTRADAQTALDEWLIEDKDLEQALEDRERAKGAKNEAVNTFNTKDEAVKDRLEEHGLKEGEPLRCGRFRIKQTSTPGREVAFETSGSTRVTISPATDDE